MGPTSFQNTFRNNEEQTLAEQLFLSVEYPGNIRFLSLYETMIYAKLRN